MTDLRDDTDTIEHPHADLPWSTPMGDARPAPPASDVPWSIPIREAGPDVPHREATWLTQLPLRPVAALGVAVVVGLVVAGLVFWPASSDDPDPDPEVLGDAVAGADDGSDTVDDSGDAEALTPYTTIASPQVVDETPTTATDSTILSEDAGTEAGPAPASAPAGPAEPADLPIVDPASLGATWVAQVSSVPTAGGAQALSDGYRKVEAEMPGTVVLRGGDWPGLSDAYWVLAVPGFGSGAEAVDACAAAGKTDRDDCFAKFVDPDDGTPRVCYRNESGSLTGDC